MEEYLVKHIKRNTKGNFLSLNEWEEASKLEDFRFPWEEEVPPETYFRALWDNRNLYFRFDVEDDNILTHVKNNHKLEVVDSDRVEIFFAKDITLSQYYCLEMDACSRVLDYGAKHYRDFDFEWNWPASDNLTVKSTKTDDGYIVEGTITLDSLDKLDLIQDGFIYSGVYRGYCMQLPPPEAKLRWISWINPNSETPDFHIPSSFGVFKLENDQ